LRSDLRQPLLREDGFVLLAVLGMTALISAMALSILLITRDDYRSTKLFLDLARARMLADNALMRVVAALAEPEDPLHPVALKPHAPLRLVEDGVTIMVTVEHESGKIDLNRADPTFILNALRRLGVAETTATAMLSRVTAERAAGRFIGDYRFVLLPAQHYEPLAERIGSLFTVATGAVGINPVLADRVAVEAIPGITAEEVAALVRPLVPDAGPVLGKYRPFLAPPRPIYSLKARVADVALPPLTRSLGLALRHIPARRRVDVGILWWRG
jgi:hypothetical protein